jgi:UDP-N-acetylglucosamine:LPS N-acetylglucosamine transferase
MKIALVCEHGGHLTEMLHIMETFDEHEFFFISNKSIRTYKLQHKKYLIDPIGTNPFRMLISLYMFLKVFYGEKPRVIVSTGAEIAIPAFIIGKLFFKSNNIFIESLCRVNSTSKSGKICYIFSDLFLVQWPQLIEKYGKKAKYFGSVL